MEITLNERQAAKGPKAFGSAYTDIHRAGSRVEAENNCDVFTRALLPKRPEKALQESETRFRQVAQTVRDFIWEVNAEGVYTYASPSVERMLGYTPAELMGKMRFYDLFAPAVREELKAQAFQAFSTKQAFRAVQNCSVAKNGTLVELETSGLPVLDEAGNLIGYRGADTDITDRNHFQHALLESSERLHLAAEAAEFGVCSYDYATNRPFHSAELLALYGLYPNEGLELDADQVPAAVHPEDRPGVLAAMQAATDPNGTGVFAAVFRIRRYDNGQLRWVMARGRTVFANKEAMGRPLRAHGILQDITERKVAEEALQRAYEEIKQLKERLNAETNYLRGEIKARQAHGQIIGRSKGIEKVLHQVEQVAPADCSVLVSGETGTGKELIAQEIHHYSPRKDRVMVLVNCAALPSALVESELFGRERGAYTGALTSQVGRFEIANGSTIFLDEVGELSMEVQAKLLRVLQQGEFQRLGSPKTHKVDVRVIAATNRDLAEEVRKGKFREDLYYRLRVFPIQIPPLRERTDDIALLAFAFMEEFSVRMGKKITKIPRKAMDLLKEHSWPGNIRELRNVIEHSVILTAGDTLKVTIIGESPTREAQPMTLAEAERQHILKTLEGTSWRIKGPHGAAVRLDMQPSTLYSRMQKLGIPHRRQKDGMEASI
jgi:PAS domain S-box-containing protein